MVKTGGADVDRRSEAPGFGRGAIGRAEVEVVIVIDGVVVIVNGADSTTGGAVVAIGGVDTAIGGRFVTVGGSDTAIGEAVVTAAETGSERRGGDGAIGSTDCVPLPPVTPRSAILLKVLEVVEEEEVFLVVSRRAFLAARSASLEER